MCRPSTLIAVGFLLLLVGALEPLGGSLAILTGSGVVALGAYLTDSEHRGFVARAFALVVVGVVGMVLSTAGVMGSDTGRSWWWGLLLVPYAIGWIMGLAGAVLWFADRLYGPPAGATLRRAGVLRSEPTLSPYGRTRTE